MVKEHSSEVVSLAMGDKELLQDTSDNLEAHADKVDLDGMDWHKVISHSSHVLSPVKGRASPSTSRRRSMGALAAAISIRKLKHFQEGLGRRLQIPSFTCDPNQLPSDVDLCLSLGVH